MSIKSSNIKNPADIKYNNILLCINNAFYKLRKYQKLLFQFLAYTAAVAMSSFLWWHWITNKTPYKLKNSKVVVLNHRKRDYNSKIPPKPTINILLLSAKSFLLANKNFFLLDIMMSINYYYDYCFYHLTSFSECLNIILG